MSNPRGTAFLICPVRGHGPSETEGIVATLEEMGWDVHWPHRDTDQNDPAGLQICADNRLAIRNADRVFVVWNGESKGSLFDLGMAWAMYKPITIIDVPNLTDGKSFTKMMIGWEALG